MLYQSAAADSLKLSAFTDKDKAFVNAILDDTCAVNTGVIQSLTKIVAKTTLAADSAIGVKGVTCVLNCLMHICEKDDCCNWEELHLEFVKLLRLCLNFIASVTSSGGTFRSLSSKIINLISISSEKHVLVKNSVVKVLSQPVIDFILNKNISVIIRRSVLKLFNHVLSQSSRCLRDEMVEAIRGQLSRLPDILLTCGDYDFQTAILELIFRFISIKASRQSLCSWFNGYPEIQTAFVSTSFKDFDTECRTFLNLANSSLGSKQLVYTFPCARAFFGETEVFKPKDEHYKEFWVDFNMGSKCVTFLCDSSSLMGSTEQNLWEVVSIPCTFVKRAILDKGRLGLIKQKGAQSLILEMGDLWRKDIHECLVSVKQIKIIFEQSSGLESLTEKVLPALFGEVFQNKSAARGSQKPSDLEVSGQKHGSLFKRTTKVSTSRVAVVSISNTTVDHVSKYKPLQVTKSPRKCGNKHSRGMAAVRTDIAVCQRAANVVPAEPAKADEPAVQEDADIQGLREILTAHHIENYSRNVRSYIISPQLSHISEEMLSQISTVMHESQKHEASIITGSAASPPISGVKEMLLNIRSGSLDQHSEQCGLVEKGKEMAVRYWETTPVVSCCSKRGEGSCDSPDQRMKHTATHKASMTPCIHMSRIERIENDIVKHMFSSSRQAKSSQTVCIKAGLGSSGSDLLINSGSRESKVLSSIKIPLGRPNKLLHRLNNTACSADEKVRAAEVAVFGRPKQLQHKPAELTKVPSSYTSQSTENCQKDIDANLTLVPESSSSSQEIVVSHEMKEFRDTPQEQTELSDLPSNEQNCLSVVEMRQAMLSCVSFRSACSGTNLADVEMSVSKNNLSHITDSREGMLVSDINGNITDKSKTSHDMCQEKNECLTAKSAVQNICDTEEVQQTENSNTKFKGGPKKLHNKHIKHSASENVSVNNSDCRMAERNVSTNEMKHLVQRHCEEVEVLTLKHNAENYGVCVEGKQAKSSGKINSRPERLHKEQRAELSVSEHSALNTSDSPAKSESCMRRDVAVKLRRTCKKPQEQTELLNNSTQRNAGHFENSTTIVCRNASLALTRLHEKQQKEMGNCAEHSFDMLTKSTAVKSRRFIKASEEQICSMNNNAQNASFFIEGRKMGNSRNTIEGKMRLNSKQQENLRHYAVNSDSQPKPAGEKFGLYKKHQEEFQALQNIAQNVSDVTEHKRTVSSRKIMEKSPEVHRKQQKKSQNCSVVYSESLAEPAVGKSRLHKEPEKQIEPLKNYAQNMSDIAKDNKVTNFKETVNIYKRPHRKRQVQMSKAPEAQIETPKSNAQKEPDIVEDKTIDSKETVKRSKRQHRKQQVQMSKAPEAQIGTPKSYAQNEPDIVEDKTIDSKETVKRSKRQHRKQQVQMSKAPEAQIETRKSYAQNKPDFIEDKTIDSKESVDMSEGLSSKQDVERGKKPKEQIKTLQSNAQDELYYVEEREVEDAKETVKVSKGLSSKQQLEVSKKLEEQIGSLEESTQGKLVFVDDGKIANSKQTVKLSKRLCSKQEVEVVNLTANSSDSVAKPTAERSVRLHNKPLEQIELSDYENNSHGQGITSMILNPRPRRFVHESEEKIGCSDSRTSEPLQNEQHTFTKKAVVNKPEKLGQMSGENITNQVLDNSYANEQIAYTEDGLNGRLKGTKNRAVSGGNSSELQQSEEMNVPGSATTCNLRQVLHKAQVDKFPGINSEEQTATHEATSEFSVMTAGGRSHEVEKSGGKIHSNSHTSSDCSIIEPPRTDGKDIDVVQISRNNHLLPHSAQKHDTSKDGKVASSSDTFPCELNIQKHGATTSDVSCSGSSDFVSSKLHAVVSRAGSKLKPGKGTKKCVQELGANRKPHRARLDPAELQQIIHEWDSDERGDRDDEFSHDDNSLHKDVMLQHVEVIKNLSTVKIQQNIKEKDISAVLGIQEHSLCDKASGTNEKNAELTRSVKSHKHLESSLVSHAISLELQKVDENSCTSKNECEVNKNSLSNNAITSGNVHEMDAAKNVKSPRQLKSPRSSSDRGNIQPTEGLSVTNNVPSSVARVQLSRTVERGSDNSKTPAHKRRLYSSTDSPEVIEFKDCDDIARTSSTPFTHSSNGAKKIVLTSRKSKVNETSINKLQDDNKERRKTGSVSAFHERDQLGVTVSSFGGQSSTAEIDVSTRHFPIKKFSGRWRTKYLEEVRIRVAGKKCKENVQHSVCSSVYSDIETDSDSVLSWLEPEKPKRSEVAQKPEVTYKKRRRTMFQSKEKKKEVRPSDTEIDSDGALNQLEQRKRKVSKILEKTEVSNEKENSTIVSSRQKKKKAVYPRQPNSQTPFCGSKESIIKSKIRRSEFSEQTNKKHSSPGRKTCGDSTVETFVTHAVEHKLQDVEVLRSNEYEQVDEAVPVEINILPGCNGAVAPDSRMLPSLIVEAKHTTGSKIPHVNEKEVLNDKQVKERNGEKCHGQVNESLLSGRGEQPVSINIGSLYSERRLKPQGQANDSSFSQKGRHSISPTIGTHYPEKGCVPQDQINDFLLSKRNRKVVSTVIGVSHSKRARESRSPCARELPPARPAFGPSVPIQVEAANCPVSVLSQCNRNTQSTRIGGTAREVIPEGSSSSQQEDVLLTLEHAAEDSANRSMQSGKGVYKSNKKNSYSNKENIGDAIVTKQRKKCKNNTCMNQMAEGSYTHGDGRTMTTKGITEAGSGGLLLVADDAGRAPKLAENSVADLESARTETLKDMNPCATQVREFMSGFIQSSAEIIEDSPTETYRKGSNKRKVLVTDYIQKCESEMEEINSKIEHLKQQEARWQELENTVKLLSQLQHKYVDEISESMSRLSNYHNCFRKQWQKLE